MRKLPIAFGLALVTIILLSMSGPRFASGAVVVASVYGEELRGVPTASGERFNPDGYTAASKTLPLGTRLTLCHEGCTDVRVNDKGPFVPGRDLDISKGAAKAIGIDEKGVAPVEVKRVSSPTPSGEAPEIVELPRTGIGR